MNTFHKKPLFLALAGVTALGAASAAQAVGVNPTGLGEVLLYPYYTVKGDTNSYNTLLSIVNTTGSVKAVKIRFHEGKASVEVLDFNIFLSGYDMWTAALIPTGGPTGGVTLITRDHSCTVPTIPLAPQYDIPGYPARAVDFRNTRYAPDVLSDPSLARLREGYFEVIEMVTYIDGSPVAKAATHVQPADHTTNKGVPANCAYITDQTAQQNTALPSGGLSGTEQITSPGTGFNAAADAVPLVQFNYNAGYQPTSSNKPNLNDADSFSVTPDGQGNYVWGNWGTQGIGTAGVDAVSASLIKNSIINEYVLDPETASHTDWVITFPTKSFYVDDVTHRNPFQSKLSKSSADCPNGGSADFVRLNTYDREEQNIVSNDTDFSPTPVASHVALCWEANVLSFGNGNTFSSSNTLGYTPPFINGWVRLDFHPGTQNALAMKAQDAVTVEFDSSGAFTNVNTNFKTFTGLPVIGFAVETFRPINTTSYAATFYHRFEPGTWNNNTPDVVQ